LIKKKINYQCEEKTEERKIGKNYLPSRTVFFLFLKRVVKQLEIKYIAKQQKIKRVVKQLEIKYIPKQQKIKRVVKQMEIKYIAKLKTQPHDIDDNFERTQQNPANCGSLKLNTGGLREEICHQTKLFICEM
jgi:hypothetical protein